MIKRCLKAALTGISASLIFWTLMGQAWSQETASTVDQTVGYQPPSFLVYLLPSLLVLATVMMTSLWLGPAWDIIAQRHIKDILPRLNALGMDEESVSGWMRWWGIAMFGAFLLFGVIFQMIPVGLGMVFVIFVSPRFILDWLIEIRQTKLRDQLVRASMGVANSCRAGLSLAQAFEKVAAETPYPLSNELIRIVRYYKGGSRIQEALREVQKRLNLESFTVFSSSVIVSLEQGGNIATALEEISKGLQEMQRLERKLESDTASGRMLAIILSSFPIFFLGLFTVLDPASMNLLYSTLIGNLVLVVVGGIVFVSFKWCMAILDVDL
jgi:tight adherence protein B